MKVISKDSLTATLLIAAFLPVNAETENIAAVEECVPIHEQLKAMGATAFSTKLLERGIDFKYGQFTVFAPEDQLLTDGASSLTDAGYTTETINDVLLFHVSAENMTESVKDPNHCGKTLLMLNQELHVGQESSVTVCSEGKVYQVGPGNEKLNTMPKVASRALPVCHGVVYGIKGALLLPTLKDITKAPDTSPTLPPTLAPPSPTKPPTRQEPPSIPPTTAPPQPNVVTPPASGGSTALVSSISYIFAGCASIVLFAL